MGVARGLSALCLVAIGLALWPVSARADRDTDLAAIDQKLQWKTGEVALADGAATLHTTDAFRFLDHDQTKLVLEKLWGNPPGSAEGVVGMIFPADVGPTAPNGRAVQVADRRRARGQEGDRRRGRRRCRRRAQVLLAEGAEAARDPASPERLTPAQ